MRIVYSNVVMILLALFVLASCQKDGVEPKNEVVVFDQLDPRESAEYYLNAMFIENDLDALKALTHPDQKDGFSKSIGSLATMLVRMDEASYEITFFEQKENLALIKFNLSMTSNGKTENRQEIMALEQVDSKWYVQ